MSSSLKIYRLENQEQMPFQLECLKSGRDIQVGGVPPHSVFLFLSGLLLTGVLGKAIRFTEFTDSVLDSSRNTQNV